MKRWPALILLFALLGFLAYAAGEWALCLNEMWHDPSTLSETADQINARCNFLHLP